MVSYERPAVVTEKVIFGNKISHFFANRLSTATYYCVQCSIDSRVRFLLVYARFRSCRKTIGRINVSSVDTEPTKNIPPIRYFIRTDVAFRVRIQVRGTSRHPIILFRFRGGHEINRNLFETISKHHGELSFFTFTSYRFGRRVSRR